MKRILQLIIFLLFSINLSAQSSKQIDSIKNVITATNNDSLLAVNYLILSDLYVRDGLKEGELYANKGLVFAENINSAKLKTIAYRNLANYYSRINNIILNFKYSKLALVEARKSNLPNAIVRSCTNLGNTLVTMGKLDSAMLIFEEGIFVANNHDSLELQLSKILINKGICERNLGKFDSSCITFYQAVKVAKSINNDEWENNGYTNIAEVKLHQGIFDSTLVNKIFSITKKWEEKKDYFYLSMGYKLLADFYLLNKDFEKVIFYCKKGINANEIGNWKLESAPLLLTLADVFFEKKLYDSALKVIDEGIFMTQGGNLDNLQQQFYSKKGKLFFEKGNYKESYKYLNKSFEYAIKNKDNEVVLNSGIYLTELFVAQKDFVQAEIVGLQTLKIANVESVYPARKSLLKLLGDLYFAKSDFKNAYIFAKEYAAVSDTMNSIENKKIAEEISTKYETVKKEEKIKQSEKLITIKENEKRWLYFGIFLLAIVTGLISFLLNRTRMQRNKLNQLNKDLAIQNRSVNSLVGMMKHETSRQFGNINTYLNNILKVDNPKKNVSKALMKIEAYKILYQNLFISSGIASISLKNSILDLFEYNCNVAENELVKLNIIGNDFHISHDKKEYLLHYINELMANSLEHAFEQIENPSINFEIEKIGEDITIIYKDNGIGIAMDKQYIVIDKGLQNLLGYAINNLQGKLLTDFKNGVMYNLTFKN